MRIIERPALAVLQQHEQATGYQRHARRLWAEGVDKLGPVQDHKSTRLLGNVTLVADAYGELSLQSERSSIAARADSATEVAFRVLRGKALAGQ